MCREVECVKREVRSGSHPGERYDACGKEIVWVLGQFGSEDPLRQSRELICGIKMYRCGCCQLQQSDQALSGERQQEEAMSKAMLAVFGR